ncbi:hypothetical protein C8R43DRAFT_1117863 [Mycena crocata]|nr:hypothetical protein C8R43DRAFT_1117863 [Mycena crocata]
MAPGLFHSIAFYLPETLSEERRYEITLAVTSNGGEQANSIDSATHIITNSNRFQGWQDAQDSKTVQIVSDLWVDRSMILGQVLPCELYSADPAKIFSGVVGCGSGISAPDLQRLEAGVIGLGGHWRHGLTKDVTHLFATSANSDKYATAMKYQESAKIKIVLPHWFNDTVRLGRGRKLSTIPYEWPDPKILHPVPSEEEARQDKAQRSSRKLSEMKRTFFKTAIWDPDKKGPFPGPVDPQGHAVWGGRKILLSPSLGLEDERRGVLEGAVKAAGGLIISYVSNNGNGCEDEEFDQVSECDVLVTRWRTGKACFKALDEGKAIGTINWVFYVHATGVLSSPMDQLLHYPTRKTPIKDFSKHEITVTNYTGEARDYIKRLISTMGARFTPNMTGTNTVLIAAHMGGIKTNKAQSWSIAVVNHTWLEDCFVQWRSLTPAVPKYIYFPPNLDFSPMLADLVFNIDDLDSDEEEPIALAPPPVGTEASAREVEGILGDGDVLMDDEDAMETEGCLAPRKPTPARGRRMVSASISPAKHTGTGEEEMMDLEPVENRSFKPVQDDPTSANTFTKRRKEPKRTDDHEAEVEPARKSSGRKGKEREKQQLLAEVDDDNEESEVETAPRPKVKVKGKSKANAKVMFAPETETDSAGPSHIRAPKKPPIVVSGSAKRKAQIMESASNGDETDARQSDSPPPKKRAKPNKVTSDVVSSSGAANGHDSSAKRKMTAGPGRDSALRKPTRTESVRALAEERPSSSKPGPSKRPAIASTSAPNSPKTQRSSTGVKKSTRVEPDAESDDVMPDMVNYGLEERTQRSRGSAGKKRDEMESADDMPPPKASKSKAKSGRKDTTGNISLGSRKATIKIMTTTISLSDTVLKVLSKLGVKTTTQVSECTHLIAPSLVRTEKLLCALAAGAFILSDKWAIESVAANKLLPEKDYILRDKTNERKWDFTLVEAMARAKEVNGKLFEKKTFYLTPRVPVDVKLLKNVVTSQGGKLSTQTPTVRILNSAPGRYVISCLEDIAVWRPLTKDNVIYSQELLLTAALTQEIDWDNPAFRVPQPDSD